MVKPSLHKPERTSEHFGPKNLKTLKPRLDFQNRDLSTQTAT